MQKRWSRAGQGESSEPGGDPAPSRRGLLALLNATRRKGGGQRGEDQGPGTTRGSRGHLYAKSALRLRRERMSPHCSSGIQTGKPFSPDEITSAAAAAAAAKWWY